MGHVPPLQSPQVMNHRVRASTQQKPRLLDKKLAQLSPTVMIDLVSHCRLQAAGWPYPGCYKGKEEEVSFHGRARTPKSL